MDSRYGVPGKVLISHYTYFTRLISLPEYIDYSPCKLDVSDPYLIYRNAVNRIFYDDDVLFYEHQWKKQCEHMVNQFSGGFIRKSTSVIKSLPYLLFYRNNPSHTHFSKESANIMINREIAIGKAYIKLKSTMNFDKDVSDLEIMRCIEYYLRERKITYKIDSDILIYQLANNLSKHNRELWNLEICEMNAALRTLEPEAQLYYYDMFINNRGNETDIWKRIRAHEFDINEKKCLEQSPAIDPISKELLERLQSQCDKVYKPDTIRSTIKYICEEYIQTVIKGFVAYKICMGIQEWNENPVFDIIGKDSLGKIKIVSFRIARGNRFCIYMDYIVEVEKEIQVKAFFDNKLKKIRLK